MVSREFLELYVAIIFVRGKAAKRAARRSKAETEKTSRRHREIFSTIFGFEPALRES